MASGRGRTKETGRRTEENVGRGMDVGILGGCCWGFAKLEKFQKNEITMEVGGWVQVSLEQNWKIILK